MTSAISPALRTPLKLWSRNFSFFPSPSDEDEDELDFSVDALGGAPPFLRRASCAFWNGLNILRDQKSRRKKRQTSA